MGSKRVVGAILRGSRRSSFMSNYLLFSKHATPSLYHALVVIFLEFFAWGLLTLPMITVLSKTFPQHTFLYNGLVLGGKGFLSFLSAPLIGGLSDIWGRKFFLLITVFFTCLPIPFMLFSPIVYFGLVVFSGLFAVTFSVIFAYVADVTDQHERAFAYGSVSATFALSLVTSPALGSYLSDLYNDDLVILLATIIALIDILFILLFVPESLPEKLRQKSVSFWETADPFGSLRKAGKDRMILTLCVSVFLSYLPEAGQYSCFFVYLKLIIGFSSTEVAIFIALIGILSMFAQTVLLSSFIKRFGSKNTIMIGLIFEMLQMICYGLGSNLWVIWGAGLIAAASSITYPAISAYVSNYADADKQGLVQGIITGIRGLCNGLGPCAFGLVFNLFNVDLNSDTPSSSHTNLHPSSNTTLSGGLISIINATHLFNPHHLSSPNDKLIPGPPFLFGALLVLLAILVMAFIPELIQYPPNSAHHGDYAFSNAGPFSSAKSRVVMSPSRGVTPRSSTSSNYFYKSMHIPDSLNDDTEGSAPSDNVKMVSTGGVGGQSTTHGTGGKPSSQRKALLSVENSTLYLPSTSCTISYSESEDREEGSSSDDEESDQAIFDRAKQQQLAGKGNRSTATIGAISNIETKFNPSQVSQAVRAFNHSNALNNGSQQSPSTDITSRPSHLHTHHSFRHNSHHHHHTSHQLLPMAATSKAFSSSPTLSFSDDQDRDDSSFEHGEESKSLNKSHLYKPLLQTVET